MTVPDEPDVAQGGYLFRGEVIEAVLRRFWDPVSDEDLDVKIREHMDWPELDKLDQVHVLLQEHFTSLAGSIVAALTAREERQAEVRSEHLSRIKRHDGCDRLLKDLLSERNDLIAGLWDVRDACSFSFENRYGEHCVDLEDLLEALRPRTPGKRARRELPAEHRGWCPECGSPDFHQDDCSIDLHAKDLAIRAGHERASHVRCSEIATELVDQIADLHLQVEARAARILSATGSTYHHEGQSVYVEHVKDFLASVPTPKAVTLTATIYPSIEDREE
jgi:hypothetical protein